MLWIYAKHEIVRRKRHTIIVAAGLAIAVALLMVVSSVTSGVSSAQASVLESVYGVGTDITVTQRGVGRGPQSFNIEQGQGKTDGDGETSMSSSSLSVGQGSTAFADSSADTIANIDGVSGETGVLELQLTDFSGQIQEAPDAQSTETDSDSGDASAAPNGDSESGPGNGGGFGGGGFGGGQFSMNTTSVTGVEPEATMGVLPTLTVESGRTFTTADDGELVALISTTYAESEKLDVDDTISLGDDDVTVVGIVDSESAELDDIYLPLATAQSLSGEDDMVTSIYVEASSANDVQSVQTAIESALDEDYVVSTQSELASSVSGSVSSAASLLDTFGKWLSVLILLVAFGLSILFTVMGVNQRTRDIGTLKSIGWTDRRIVFQVAFESMLRAAVGAVAGIVLALLVIVGLNAAGITLSGSTGGFSMGNFGGNGGSMPDRASDMASQAANSAGGFANSVSSGVDVVLHSPISVEIILVGLIAALAGGLLAGIIGGWRAARLRPAQALRSL